MCVLFYCILSRLITFGFTIRLITKPNVISLLRIQ